MNEKKDFISIGGKILTIGYILLGIFSVGSGIWWVFFDHRDRGWDGLILPGIIAYSFFGMILSFGMSYLSRTLVIRKKSYLAFFLLSIPILLIIINSCLKLIAPYLYPRLDFESPAKVQPNASIEYYSAPPIPEVAP